MNSEAAKCPASRGQKKEQDSRTRRYLPLASPGRWALGSLEIYSVAFLLAVPSDPIAYSAYKTPIAIGYTLPTMLIPLITQSVARGLKTGFALAAATNAVIMLASDEENGSPWAALNCVAHIVDGDEKEQPTDYSPRESLLGITINGTAMAAWGVLYEGALLVTKTKSSPLTAILAVAAAYVIDYKVVPKQYTPGIEKRLSLPAIGMAYGAMAVMFALSPLWNKK